MILDIFSLFAKALTRLRPLCSFARPGALTLTLLSVSLALPYNTSLAQDKSTYQDYSSLKALFDRRRYKEVVDEGEKAATRLKKGDSDSLRIKILVTLAASKYQPLLNTAVLAKEAYDSDPANAVAASNYAGLELAVGDRELAGQLFEKALSSAPDDFLSHIGLAEQLALDPKRTSSEAMAAALVELTKAESAGNTLGLSAVEKWIMVGDHYLTLREPGRALSAYLNAEKLAGTGAVKTNFEGLISQDICRAALACGQIALCKPRLDGALAAQAVSGDLSLLVAEKLCPPTDQGTELAKRVFDKAVLSKGGDYDYLYKLGRAFGHCGQEQYARLCLERAAKGDPTDGKFAVAYAAQLAKYGDTEQAVRQLTSLARRYRLDEPTPQRSLALGLARAGLSLLKDYDSDWAKSVRQTLRGKQLPLYKTAYANLSKLKCHCRLLAMQYILNRQPGVVFAYIPDDKEPVGLLIYDSKVTAPGPVWDKISNDATIAPLAREESLRDFQQLVQVALDYSEATYRPLKEYLAFSRLPLRLL